MQSSILLQLQNPKHPLLSITTKTFFTTIYNTLHENTLVKHSFLHLQLALTFPP